jgi:hypothetical protein
MKRILSLDGGGIRGLFSLEVLARIESELRQKTNKPDLVLADYFHFIGGTSTGAIIAASLAWGLPVGEIKQLYLDQCTRVFRRKSTLFVRLFYAKYTARELSDLLRIQFSEDGQGKQPALMGTRRLRTLLLVMMRNGATGSPWPVTNNPHAKYNAPELPDCNLNIPLWQLIRASTAAPTIFPPEEIILGGRKHIFIDGAITPFNNPSFHMFLNATLPRYRIGWEPGEDKILLVSVGTGRVRVRFKKSAATSINKLDQASHAAVGLIDNSSLYQDVLCRAAGHCLEGEPIDSEIGTMLGGSPETSPWPKQFTYVRYNHEFSVSEEDAVKAAGISFEVDDLNAIHFLCRSGEDYARKHVKAEHLPV